MLRKLLTENHTVDQQPLVEEIYQSLKAIQRKLEEEIGSKQKVIEGSWDEIRKLRSTLQQKRM